MFLEKVGGLEGFLSMNAFLMDSPTSRLDQSWCTRITLNR